MIIVDKYINQQVAVLGLSQTGRSAVRSLVAGGADVLAWDDDPNKRSAGNTEGGRIVEPSAENWKKIEALVLSPGIPLYKPVPHLGVLLADKLGVEVLGDIELFARSIPYGNITAITGTNGKSTTTALIGHILGCGGYRTQIGANLGKPVLDFDQLDNDGHYVLELSSYQIDLLKNLSPKAVALLNISPDHLERHGDMQTYVQAKRRLLDMTIDTANAVIAIDDSWTNSIAKEFVASGRKVTSVTTRPNRKANFFAKNNAIYRSEDITNPIVDLRQSESLKGRHNWQNALVAFAVTEKLGIRTGQIIGGLRTFPGLPHRMEVVGRSGRVTYINDSKATNAEATANALAANEQIFWIAGGLSKKGGLSSLVSYLHNINRVFLIGDAAEEFARVLGDKVACERSGNLREALYAAHSYAQLAGEGTVLLSPACASFDQYENFEMRGEAFRELVSELLTPVKPKTADKVVPC